MRSAPLVTKTAVSAGGVVVREDRQVREMLVLTREHGRVRCLPKGTVEVGETHEQAAVREVREEGGVDARILEQLPTIDYWFYWRPEKTRYHKFVHFYLMRYIDGDVADHDHEVEEADWVPAPDAVRALTFAGERDTAILALERLDERAASGVDDGET